VENSLERYSREFHTGFSALRRGGVVRISGRGERVKNDRGSVIKNHAVVSHEEWLVARTTFLAKEKEFTRLQDQLSQERRELPWEAVRKEYVFEGPNGKQTLAQLFDGKSQLIVYHFMFEPNAEAGCPHCSLRADGFNGIGELLR
jgi:predicted dithiol-disulfide oxidoreductase (DUF899 family)